MNGIHDMGGMHGMGPIRRETDEPIFHAAWEGRLFALSLAAGAHLKSSIDAGRHAIEQMDPVAYLRASYYERWLHEIETLLVAEGLVTRAELAARIKTIAEEGG